KQGAIEDCTQAIRLDPKDAAAYSNRGLVRADLGDKRGAIEDYQEAARLFLEQKDMDSYNALLGVIKALQSNQPNSLQLLPLSYDRVRK
ncbi:MAG: tetratricopeptide repeat protein, partial [Phormidesmis sp. CAN_BIN44]|nr:tetratricopeptide repeat protein [Phormidesmis sp. CAN_BIN44]